MSLDAETEWARIRSKNCGQLAHGNQHGCSGGVFRSVFPIFIINVTGQERKEDFVREGEVS